LKGKTYNHERIRRVDAETGTEILQLTSFPTMSHGIGYALSNFSRDSSRLIFLSKRSPQRDSPLDLFIVGVDGSGLTQLTECEDLCSPNLAPDGSEAYFVRGSSLWKVSTEDFQEEEIANFEGGTGTWAGYLSPDGTEFFIGMRKKDKNQLVKFDIGNSSAEPIADDWFAIANDPEGKGLLCCIQRDTEKTYGFITYDGELLDIYTRKHDFAHSTLLGPTTMIQGCALPPQRAILTMGLGDEEPVPLVEGPYFWHSSASEDGKWIIADTNWPNEGLQLVSVEMRKFRSLCYPNYSGGHPQWTHPHPCLSPDCSKVLFNSDATGICQVYLATIPEGFLEEGWDDD